MCNYLKKNKCLILKNNCPYVYFCNKKKEWIPLSSMPKKCKVQDNIKIPKGCYKVRMERNGYLYIDINESTYKFINPFEDIPFFVKLIKTKDGEWKIKK